MFPSLEAVLHYAAGLFPQPLDWRIERYRNVDVVLSAIYQEGDEQLDIRIHSEGNGYMANYWMSDLADRILGKSND